MAIIEYEDFAPTSDRVEQTASTKESVSNAVVTAFIDHGTQPCVFSTDGIISFPV